MSDRRGTGEFGMEFDLCIQDDVEFSKSLAWVTGGVGGIRRGGSGPLRGDSASRFGPGPAPSPRDIGQRLGIHRLDLGILRRTERRVVQRPAGLPRSVPSVCRRAG